MTKSSSPIAKRFQNATTFYEQLKLALEYQAQPEILREHSPLAQPYFLNQHHAKERLPADWQNVAQVDWG